MSLNVIKQLFGIKYPIIQGGMVWNSGWRLASAVSNAGGLGLIGAGSMTPELLEQHIIKCKTNTEAPFGINIPLLYKYASEFVDQAIKHGVPIVFTSAGSPNKYTERLKVNGIKVVHVVASLKFAEKAELVGVDAIVAEGFEAGGHNGLDETTTLCLIPLLKKHIETPIIAAGGIATGRAILAAFAMGADGVQIGSRFAASVESSAHDDFKQKIVTTSEGQTQLTLKSVTPVRLIKNQFYQTINEKIKSGAKVSQIKETLGKGRSKKGMFEGDLKEGELEIGQVSAVIDSVEKVNTIFDNLVKEYNEARKSLSEDIFKL